MKTKQFIKEVKHMGFEAREYHLFPVIEIFKSEEQIAAVWMNENRLILTTTCDIPFIKLCLEYAETPIKDREEEKEDIVILPDPRNVGEYRYALCKRLDSIGMGIGRVHRSRYSKLTESEIKRNHEYLWQFEKEVEMEVGNGRNLERH